MGNRAIVRFDDEQGPHCGIYLHWNGDQVVEWLRAAAPNMRKGNASYAAARFVAYCAEQIPGGLSLGILKAGDCTLENADWQDNGMFVVNVADGAVRHVHGAGKPGRRYRIKLGEF